MRRPATHMAGLLLVVLAASLVGACSFSASTPAEDADAREALVEAVGHARRGSGFDLRNALGTDWDTADFLAPYATNDHANDALGFDFDIESVSPWTRTEGGAVIVLRKDGRLVRWLAVSSEDVGLHCLYHATLRAGSHSLMVTEEGGFRRLVYVDLRKCSG